MHEQIGWSQRARSVEECATILQTLDARTLQRRAERLSIEGQIQTEIRFDMANRTADLLDEAGACFTIGQYTGCVLALATGVEHGLRELLDQPKAIKLNKLIQVGVDALIVTDAEAKVLQALKDYRNQVTHSDIDELAAGTTLRRSTANFKTSGVEVVSDWETIIPESQDHKEIASDLAAERIVGTLLVNVNHVVHDIFGRRSALNRALEPCE